MVRTLKVVLYEPSGRGGICHYSYELAQALAGRGADVTLLTTSNYELEHLPRRFRRRFVFKASILKRLLSTLLRLRPGDRKRGGPLEGEYRRRAPRGRLKRLATLRGEWLKSIAAFFLLVRGADVLHVQSGARGRDLAFIRILRAFGLRVVYTAHDVLPHGEHSREEGTALARTYQSVDHVIVHAESNRQELMHLFGVEEDRISVIPHGSYDFLFRGEKLDKQEARSRVGFPLDRQIVLFFGLIKRYKGLEFLVEAFRTVEERIPNATLAIVGDVFSGDPEGYRYYSRLLDQASRRSNVVCVTRYVPVDRVGLYLTAADVVVLPYTKTYQSGVLLSAYAAGRPVVVTETGGLAEVVENGKSGIVVPTRNSSALAEALRGMLADPEALAEMGERAAELARTRFAWDRIAQRTLALYQTVLERAPARPTANRPEAVVSAIAADKRD